METRPCIICECQLECAVDNWDTNQPYCGGEVKFNFHYGSCRFDLNMHGTEFAGIICDDCAEKCIERMVMITKDTRTGSLTVPFKVEYDASEDQERQK